MGYRKGLVGIVAVLALFATIGGRTPPPDSFSAQLAQASGGAAGRTLHFTGVLTDPVTGNPLSGNFSMKFSIFGAETAGAALWTETQTSVQVRRGVFNVQLGSVTAFPDGLFDGSARYLEIQIDSDPPLSPRVLVVRVGNSFFADRAADVRCAGGQCVDKEDLKDRAIGREKLEDKAVGRGQLDDKAVGRGQLEDKAVGRDQVEDKAVGRGQLDDKAVGRGQLEDKAVGRGQVEDKAVGRGQVDDKAVGRDQIDDGALGTAQLADGAVTAAKISDDTIETGDLADGAVTNRKLADDAVNSAKVDDGTITAQDLAAGAVAADKLAADVLDLVRAQPGARASFDLATLGASAGRADVAIGVDGLPILAAAVAAPSGAEVHAIHCEDPACGEVTDTTIASLAGPGGLSIVVGADGRPFLFYQDPSAGFVVVRCDDVACTGTGTPTTVFGSVSYSTALLAADGLPLVLVDDGDIVHCLDDGCTSFQHIFFPTQGPLPAMTMGSDGLPVLVAFEVGGEGVGLVRCGDPGCSSPGTAHRVASDVRGSGMAVAVGPDGLPVVAYVGEAPPEAPGPPRLKIVHCADLECSSTDTPGATALLDNDDALMVGETGIDGRPFFVVLGREGPGVQLRIVRCAADNCSTLGTTPVLPVGDPPTSPVRDPEAVPAVTVGADGYPVIALPIFGPSGPSTGVVHCSNRFCVPYFREH